MEKHIILKKWKIISLAFIIILTIYVLGYFRLYSKPMYHGKVIDVESKQPIPNVVITLEYWVDSYGIIEQNSKSIYWIKTRSDQNGYFEFPAFHKRIGLFSWDDGVTFSFIKENYAEILMLDLDKCLSSGCEEFNLGYFRDPEKKFTISSNLVEMPKL